VKLRDPETCPNPYCGGHTRVINKRNRDGKVWRRHECHRCLRRWTSWQSLADPDLIDPSDLDPAFFQVNR
jgi:transcriptional regulator NrdR family protein